MSRVIIYLDESGDLGWKFNAPYRNGGSSRYLTIASLIVDPSVKHLPKRLIKVLYQKYGWSPEIEKKWSDMNLSERTFFSEKAKKLFTEQQELIRYVSITVKKEHVMEHIRQDENKLYNYMINLSLVNEMAKHSEVAFLPDPRSIKVESGNSLHDYLQTQLWFDKQVETVLKTKPCDSAASKNIQFADMLSGIVQGHFEDGNSKPWSILRECISYKTLYF